MSDKKTKKIKIRVSPKNTVTFNVDANMPHVGIMIYQGQPYVWNNGLQAYLPSTVFNVDEALKREQEKEIVKP